MPRLRGQVAVVTGAGSGMGRASALALAAEGATLALVGRRVDLIEKVAEEIRATGREVLVCQADITDASAMETMAKAATERFGRLDILVNAAGDNVKKRGLGELTPEDWRYIVDIDLTGAFLCTRAVLPAMRAQGRGTIIHVSSMASKQSSVIGGVAYSAAKAGVDRLTEAINLEERRHGIRACRIHPGETDTPLMRRRPYPILAAGDFANMLQPEDIAAAVVFVATLDHRATVEELTILPTVLRT